MINPLPKAVNIRYFVALVVFIAASAITIIIGFSFYQYQKKDIGTAASHQLSAIAELKVWEISNWRNERIGDANVICKNDSFAENVDKYFNNSLSPELKQNILSLLTATQKSYQYQNILLIDKNKKIRLAIEKIDPEFGVHHSDIINKAFERNDIIISDIHRDERNNGTHISVVVPIVMLKKSVPIPVGTVIILIDPQHRLYPTIKQWPLPSETGEALLVHREGNDVVYLNELRHVRNTPLMLRYPITEKSLPAVKAVLGLKGTFEGIDYRKKKVFAAVKPVPGTTWFLVAKIDQEEIYAPLALRLWLTILFVLVTIAVLGMLLAYAWRNQQAKYYQEKYELEDRRSFLYARSLIEASLDPLVTISPDGKIMDVNKSTEFITGRTRTELIGSDFFSYFTEPEKAEKGYKLVFEKGVVRDYPLSIKHVSGRVTDVLYNASLYKNEAGEVQGIFAAARDVTALKRAQDELKTAHDELESRVEKRTDELKRVNSALELEIRERKEIEKLIELRTRMLEMTNKELESFSYSVSHDLRAPLRAIDGYSRMILRDQRDCLNDEAKRKFDLIRSNTQVMGKLIDDLLTFSRLGRLDINVTRLDMEGLVNDVWMELQIINPDRRIDFKMESIPQSMGDRTLIKQVISNLLSNAVKYTKNKMNAQIETGGYREKDENIYYIKDNGVGFDMEYYDKLFGVFQRLHSVDEFEGTGVGLAIVQRIIHRHGGRVWAQGQVEEGATFYFTLPVRN